MGCGSKPNVAANGQQSQNGVRACKGLGSLLHVDIVPSLQIKTSFSWCPDLKENGFRKISPQTNPEWEWERFYWCVLTPLLVVVDVCCFFFQSPLGLLWVFDGHWKSNLIIEITVVLTHGLSITQWLFLMFFGLFWMFFDNPVYLWCFDAWWWSVCVLFNIYIYILYIICAYIYNHWLLLFCFFIVIHPLLMVPRQKPLDITGLQSSPTGCVSAWSWRQWLPGDRHSCASAAWRCGNVKLGFNEHADLTDLTDLTIKKLININ